MQIDKLLRYQPRMLNVSAATFILVTLMVCIASQAQAPHESGYMIGHKTIAYTNTDGVLGPQLGSGVYFDAYSIRPPMINEQGDIAYSAEVSGDGVDVNNDNGIWLYKESVLSIIARTGSTGHLGPSNPDDINATYTGNTLFADGINNHGQVAIKSVMSPSISGLWRHTTGLNDMLALVNTSGPYGPGLGSGVRFIPQLSTHFFSDSGALFLNHSVNKIDPIDGGQHGIWRVDASGAVPLARVSTSGQLGPGLGGGREFIGFDHLAVDPDDSVYVSTSFDDDSAGIVKLAGAGNTLYAETGTDGLLGPGLGADAFFSRFRVVEATDTDQLIASARLVGDQVGAEDALGLWRVTSDSITPIARSGDDQLLGPGMGEGVVFLSGQQLPDLFSFRNIAGRGGVAVFGSSLFDPNASQADQYGIFHNAGNGNTPIAVVGDDGDQGPGIGEGYVFSGLGEVAVTEDGSVVFVGDVVHPTTNTVKNGIWIYRDGVVSNLMLEGQVVNVGAGASFNHEFVSRLGWDQDRGLDAVNNRLALSVWFESGHQAAMVLDVNIPGDLDGDGFVGISDLNAVISHWNHSVPIADLSSGDTNGDGFVGIDDLNAVLGNWNAGTPPAGGSGASVPEPGSLILMAVLGVGLCQRASGKVLC